MTNLFILLRKDINNYKITYLKPYFLTLLIDHDLWNRMISLVYRYSCTIFHSS